VQLAQRAQGLLVAIWVENLRFLAEVQVFLRLVPAGRMLAALAGFSLDASR
jgi:hypothetical protein